MTVPPPDFDTAFQGKLAELFAWRRDVRHFRRDPVEPALIQHLLEVAALAPSVGNSQPWRFVLVEDPTRRQKVITNFEHENAEALGVIALSQIVNPGAPMVYGGFTSNADMRSGAPAFGTPEYTRAAWASRAATRSSSAPRTCRPGARRAAAWSRACRSTAPCFCSRTTSAR